MSKENSVSKKLTLEDVDITLPENVSIQLSSDTASYPTRTEYFLKQNSDIVTLCERPTANNSNLGVQKNF
jgi:hypothetical protein